MSEQNEATPGPWNVAHGEIFSTANDALVATVHSGKDSQKLLNKAISAYEADCNAELIAAAPAAAVVPVPAGERRFVGQRRVVNASVGREPTGGVFSRATTAYVEDSEGRLVEVAPNVPRTWSKT